MSHNCTIKVKKEQNLERKPLFSCWSSILVELQFEALFLWREENPEKSMEQGENQQQTQPTYSCFDKSVRDNAD